MKTKYIAPLIAFWSSAFLLVLLLFIDWLGDLNTLSLFIVVCLDFVFVWFIVRFWLKKELYDKVRTIYKNIYNFKINKKELKNRVDTDKVELREVSTEVDKWIEEQSERIDQMIAMEKYRKEYIGNVAHELKTPIFTIQGYISTLLDGAMEEKELTKKYLLRTEAAIERMTAIVNDLGVISRLESGEIQLEISRFDLQKLALEAIESLEDKAREHNCEIVLHNQDAFFVSADRNRIRQVFSNLLDNAITYSKEEGGQIKVKFYDMDDLALVEVADQGIGVAEQDMARLFERFFRTDKARSVRSGGTGLGLAIVKHIIEAHRQTINVRSRLGEGTTFGFTLQSSN